MISAVCLDRVYLVDTLTRSMEWSISFNLGKVACFKVRITRGCSQSATSRPLAGPVVRAVMLTCQCQIKVHNWVKYVRVFYIFFLQTQGTKRNTKAHVAQQEKQHGGTAKESRQ